MFKFLRFLACSVCAAVSISAAGQPAPAPPHWPGGVIWDDFEYSTAGELTARSPWCVGGALAVPAAADECAVRREKAWYRSNWAENTPDRRGAIVMQEIGSGRALTLNLQEGRSYGWPDVPGIVSGFLFRTGTWYARLRLQDFSGWTPGSSTSFWTRSTMRACADVERGATCSGARAQYWSEWNYEWTTRWNVQRGSQGPWMASGAVVDGDGHAIGGAPLRAALVAEPYTCADPNGRQLSWNRCREYFINGREAPDEDGPYVDVMIRFDGESVHWEAMAYANGAPLQHPWVKGYAITENLGAGQNVLTTFTATPDIGERVRGDRWYVAEWFLFTPQVDKSVEDMVSAARWLHEVAGHERLNTTGESLSRPRSSTGLRLESRQDGLRDGEFLVLPPDNYLTYYDIFWSYRATNRTRRDGRPDFAGGWRDLDDHSMKAFIPDVQQYRYSEVRVRYRLHEDQYGIHVGPIDIPATDEACISSSNYGLKYTDSCAR